ncbi:MAG: hypothetical protein WBA67_17620 [Jannaschia sp.]
MTLINLNFNEIIEFDHDVLADLCARHGTRTEAVIAAALGQVEDLLVLAGLQVDSGEYPGLGRTCRDLLRLADHIGMRTLGHAVEAVQDCLVTRNDAALAACASRMLRLGHPETIAQWTVRHHTVA